LWACTAALLLAGCQRPTTDAGARAVPGAAAVLRPAAFAPATPERGRAAIQAYGCGSCHMIPGVRGAVGLVGPPLLAWSRRTVIAGELPNTPENLVDWIMRPQSIEPGTAMPDLGVSDADARAIAAYLATLD
jgi:cytochrome c1